MPPLFETPRPSGHRWAWLLILFLLALHSAQTWGTLSTFRGDTGRWLHEVDRFSQGEVLYRDFTWAFPPLAMWVLGGIARVLGSDLWVLWGSTLLIAAGIFVCYERYVSRLAPREVHLFTVVSGFLLATVFAAWRAAPIPQGIYAPPLTLGFLTFLISVLCLLEWIGRSRPLIGFALGLFAGLSVLAKQEFWIPAAYVVGAAFLVVVLERRAGVTTACAALLFSFAATVGTGTVAVLLQSDWAGLTLAISGIGPGR